MPVLFAALIAFFGLVAFTSDAQTADPEAPAVLVADEVLVSEDKTLIARGNVEVFQDGVSLTATSITYDPSLEKLVLEGPLVLKDGEDIRILASQGELDRDLQNGILQSARVVLSQRLQLAAVQINRAGGRYNQLYKAAVTSCRVCDDGRPPLWQIRAKRVIHDTEEKQLYFEGAQFRVGDIPIFYLPRLRLPDPTLDRATGFLTPSIKSTSQLGFGVRVPYFIRLGDHKDLTLTPFLSPETRTLEFRYRQAFRTGRITFDGAYTQDDLRPDESRYYLFGTGAFNLRQNFKLRFDIETTSDDAYLRAYDFSTKDRLDSAITLSRTQRDEYIEAGVTVFDSLRDGEIQSQLPTIVVDGLYERRLFPAQVGGELRLTFAAHSHHRSSGQSVGGLGRDVTRLHGEALWLRSWTFGNGLIADAQLGLTMDVFETKDDDTFGGGASQAVPQGAFALRYPMSKTGADGAIHFLEPTVQLAHTGGDQLNVAIDESTRVEFDEGNLFALSRFAEPDRREHDTSMAIGVNWARYDPDGWESFVSFGQIFRGDPITDFSTASGLDGTRSDLLMAGHIRTQSGLALTARALLDNAFSFSKATIRADYTTPELNLGGSFLWLEEDAAENRTRAVSELTLDSRYRVSRHWTLDADWRYDLEDDRTARAGLGLGYDNECVSVDLTVERRFASSTSVEPTTNFGFTIALRGFSAQNGRESYTRSCSSPAS